ncbi:MAG: BMP family ABC transporter substrate-binding protein [Candidatus Dormibacteraeota bacterium]|nr:BMP family ABC transporter substrate-binding protein [Candidatus Dormibacteraeota bacterium]
MRGLRVLGGLLAAIMVFAVGACGGSSPSGSGASCSKTWKVGLVTDVGKLSDKSFNFDSYKGVQDAEADSSLCVKGKAIESSTPDDYPKNIQTFLDQKYDMIIGVGFNLGDAVTAAAKANSGTKFVLVDAFDFADKTPPANLIGLLFQEDQPGFLAGALAALVSKTGTIGVVAGLQTVPPVVRYVEGYAKGAAYAKAGTKVLKIYQPESGAKDFNDPDWGKQQGQTFISQGADVIFGAGGQTGNGALLAAKDANKFCVGVDVDQYISYPDVDSCLITSAEKHLDLAVKQAVTDMVKGTGKGGIVSFNIQNDGIGLAPYHDNASKIPADVQTKITDIQAKLKSGAITTGVTA